MSREVTKPTGGGRLLPTTRLEAFSDGVFAIAITLLVLELHVPTDPIGLLHELGAEWPSYLGYFVSFAFIGGVWMAHSNLTPLHQGGGPGPDGPQPAPAALRLVPAVHDQPAGEPPRRQLPRTSRSIIFGINLTLASLMVNVMFGYAARTPGLATDDAADDELRSFDRERRVAVIIQAVATLFGLFIPVVAVIDLPRDLGADPGRPDLARAARQGAQQGGVR